MMGDARLSRRYLILRHETWQESRPQPWEEYLDRGHVNSGHSSFAQHEGIIIQPLMHARHLVKSLDPNGRRFYHGWAAHKGHVLLHVISPANIRGGCRCRRDGCNATIMSSYTSTWSMIIHSVFPTHVPLLS